MEVKNSHVEAGMQVDEARLTGSTKTGHKIILPPQNVRRLQNFMWYMSTELIYRHEKNKCDDAIYTCNALGIY